MIKALKILVILTWAGLAIAPFLLTDSTMALYCVYGLGLMAAAHLLEFPFYISIYKKADGSMANHFLMTMLYGFFHFIEVKNSLPEYNE